MSAKPIPDGYHSITPYLIVKDPVAALDFYKRAFGATEAMRLVAPDGSIAHAEIRIGNSHVMLSGEWPDMDALSPPSRGGATSSLMIYVEDCDAVFARAVAAGGTAAKPLQDQFYGDRAGTILDPSGHKWTVATHKEDVPVEECQRRMEAMFGQGASA